MWTRTWRWRVGHQTVRAAISMVTPRETIVVDDTTVFDRMVWKLGHEIPIELDGGRPAKLIVSTGRNLRPNCVLQIDGATVAPVETPTAPLWAKVVVSCLTALALWVLILMVAPPLIGGSEFPPPRWTERDLLPMPGAEDNAWHAIVNGVELPDRDWWLLDDQRRLLVNDEREAADELERPEVVAVLEGVPEVLQRTTLVVPEGKSCSDALDLREWQYWLALSQSQRLPQSATETLRTLTSTFPLWIDCANTARTGQVFLVCAKLAEYDLALMLTALEHVERSEGDVRRHVAESVSRTPNLSTDNLSRASYVDLYADLRSLTDESWLWIDKRQTAKRFNQVFPPTPAFCARDRDRRVYGLLFVYNDMGRLLVDGSARIACIGLEETHAYLQKVATLRASVLAASSTDTDSALGAPSE